MMVDPMLEPEGPEDERFVYVVTAAGVEAVRAVAVSSDSEREARPAISERRRPIKRSGTQD